MKRGTRIAVFIVSMALTAGSLVALVGHRHCGPSRFAYGSHCPPHATWSHCDQPKGDSTAK